MTLKPLAFATPEITEQDVDAVVRVLRSGWITTGKEASAFESEIAEFVDIPHVVTVSSCTTAEEICLAFLDLPRGAPVGVPTWTFVSTALAVERAGGVPVLIDVDADSLNMSLESFERAADQGLAAVVGVHYAGTPVAKEIRDSAARSGIPFIEDAAHAFGSYDERGMIGGRGNAGACFSFYATKNLSTGEGGAIATDNPALAAFARQYRLHGMSTDAVNRYSKPGAHSYDVTMPGLKANMPDLLAALGRSQLARFKESQAHRRDLVRQYRRNLADAELRFIPGERLDESADHLLVIDALSLGRRNAIIDMLAAENIGSSVHFRPLHTFSWFAERSVAVSPGGLEVAQRLDGRIMSLPLHVGLSVNDVDRVCSKVVEALAS